MCLGNIYKEKRCWYDKMVSNKKGQQMTLGTIIAIVLGIAVLVFLIFGFSTGWNNMWNKITELGGGSVNVDDVVRGCEVACASQSVDAFCRQERTINYGDGKTDTGSCKTFLNNKDKVNANIKSCSLGCEGVTLPSLDQEPKIDSNSNDEDGKKCGDLEPAGVWVVDATCPEGKEDLTSRVTDLSNKGDNNKCCSE